MTATLSIPTPVPARHWRTVLVLAAALAVSYTLAINNQWAIKPDSSLYLCLGRSLAEGRGMDHNGQQMWGIPPAVPALIAACRLVTGSDGFWLINLLMKLFAVGTAIAAFGIVRRLCADRPEEEQVYLAAGAMLVVGLSARLFTDSTFIMTDVPFTFCVALGLYCFVRARDGRWAWYLAGALAMGAATWMRLLAPILFIGMFAAMALDMRPGYRKRLPPLLAAGAIAAASALVWVFLVRARADTGVPDYLQAAQSRHFGGSSAARWGEMATELGHVPAAICGALTDQKLPWLNLVLTALILVGLVSAARRRQLLVVLPTAFYLGFLVVWGSGAVAARYLLPILPLLAYCLLAGASEVVALAARRRNADTFARWSRIIGVVAAAALCLVVSLPKDVRQVYWMRHPQFYEVYDNGHWAPLVEVGRLLRQRGRPGSDQVASDKGAMLGYLSGLRVAVRPLWSKTGPSKLGPLPPQEFADTAARGPCRFVIIPTENAAWSEAAIAAMRETRAFAPPDTIGNFVVFERAP